MVEINWSNVTDFGQLPEQANDIKNNKAEYIKALDAVIVLLFFFIGYLLRG